MKRLAAIVLRAVRALAPAVAAAFAPAFAATTITDDRGRVHRFAAPPSRIVSLMPSITETVCALGACERVVATDRFSDWPAAVRALPKLGGLEDTPVERVVALKPDVVLAPLSSRAVDRLEALGLAVVTLEPKSLADSGRVVAALASLLGRPEAGATLWREVLARIDAAAARVPPPWRGARVYFEVGAEPYAAGEASFVGEVLARLGLANVVPAAMGPFPKLNPEYVVRARPDAVMAGAEALAGMPRRPGWTAVAALAEGRVCAFAAERFRFMVRPGPRLADTAEEIAACLASLPPRR